MKAGDATIHLYGFFREDLGWAHVNPNLLLQNLVDAYDTPRKDYQISTIQKVADLQYEGGPITVISAAIVKQAN